MSRRLSPIEKLARDICWAEWVSNYRPPGTTKATYWERMNPAAQDTYVRDAEWLLFVVKKLKPNRILSLVDFK